VQHSLDHELGLAIGIDRRSGSLLGDRHDGRDTVGRTGGRKDQAVDTIAHHRIEQILGSSNVVVKIEARIAHRLWNERKGGEMHYAFDPGILAKAAIQRFRPQEVTMKEVGSARYRGEMPTAQVIEDDDVMPGLDQFLRGDTANIAGPSGYEYTHERLPSVLVQARAISPNLLALV
jgi:hypothetical protein